MQDRDHILWYSDQDHGNKYTLILLFYKQDVSAITGLDGLTL